MGGHRKSTRHFNLVLFPYLAEINPAIPFTNRYFGFNLCLSWCTIQNLIRIPIKSFGLGFALCFDCFIDGDNAATAVWRIRMNKSQKRIVILCVVLCLAILTFSGCSKDVYGVHLEGVNVIWTPAVAIWKWLWRVFTPDFWHFIELSWTELPIVLNIIVGILANILGAALYVAIIAVILAVALVVCILCSIVWFFGAIFNGIFHFA